METNQIYKVSTGMNAEKLLAYARGDEDAIKDFFYDKRDGEIYLDPIMDIIPINEKDVEERKKNLEERARIEQRLCELERALRG